MSACQCDTEAHGSGLERSGEEEKPSKLISKALEWAEPPAAGESGPAVGSAGSICGASYHLPHRSRCVCVCVTPLNKQPVRTGLSQQSQRGWPLTCGGVGVGGFGSPPAPLGVTPPLILREPTSHSQLSDAGYTRGTSGGG